MSRPQMFLIAGVNGSGKSTFTQWLRRKYPDVEIIDPDAIARGMTGSFSTIDSEALGAGRQALHRVQKCIKGGIPFAIESTISGRVYLRYLAMAKEAGFKTLLFYMVLESADMSAKRVANRVANGGHNIPTNDIKRRYTKSMQNLKPHLRLCDLGYVYNNSKEFSLIASYRNGILYRQSDVPIFMQSYI